MEGKPDFVFPKLKLAVFVDGCFWHGCPLHATQPKSNSDFWQTKLARNQARDRFVTRSLNAQGWKVLRIWEHELAKKNGKRLAARLRRAGIAFGTSRLASRGQLVPELISEHPPKSAPP